jgi:hypothetical protein
VQPHYPIGIGSARYQLQAHRASARLQEGNALADEHWNDVDDEFVDLSGVQKCSDEPAPADQPNVLSLGAAQPTREGRGALSDEHDILVVPRPAGEDVVLLAAGWPKDRARSQVFRPMMTVSIER